MKYDVVGHVLLSDEAAELTLPQLEEQNELAEELLRITGDPTFINDGTGQWGDRVLRFVVLQVNHQVASLPLSIHQTGDSVGPVSASFRSRADGAQFTVHTMVADGLLAMIDAWWVTHPETVSASSVGGWELLRSLRPVAPPTLPISELRRR